ncbi:hypothetical protein LEP1GSC021_5069 [Leptospira noguchii str. 1993005606]|nr:hypothetical protein LEP1GSC021_5069 [Leptospira noguchii str. 1993005606]
MFGNREIGKALFRIQMKLRVTRSGEMRVSGASLDDWKGCKGMEEDTRKKGYVLGEAVRDKRSGQKMYVEVAWNPEVSCVYFDAEKEILVKVRIYPDDLERVKELLPYLPK